MKDERRQTETKFIRYASLNKARFAELLEKARGSRTMKKFADDCGVNPSTFSRISNQLNKGASSTELIHVIAEKADPDSGVTLENLMEANGYLPEGDRNAMREFQMRMESACQEILYDNLKELTSNEIVLETGRIRIGKSMSFIPDIIVDNILLDGKMGQWLIDILPTSVGSRVSGSSRTHDNRRLDFMNARRIQERIGIYLSAYCMMPEEINIARISMAICDEDLYKMVLNHFGEYKTNDSISFILINMNVGKLQEEYVLRDRKGMQGESLINIKQEPVADVFIDDIDGIIWDDEE